MTHHLLVTPDRSNLTDLSLAIEARDGFINWAASGQQVLASLSQPTVDLVLADETLGDMTGLEFIKRLVALNPLINCAAVSSLPNDAYHEASEGLGILMQLPPNPGRAEGDRLMAHLNQILGLTATTIK